LFIGLLNKFTTILIKNRLDIKNFIIQLESEFNVNDWKVNETYIWPLLRIKLFFYLIRKIELSNIESKPILKTPNYLTKIKNYFFTRFFFIAKYIFFKNKLRQTEYLFLGEFGHRVLYNNEYFNRFFDTLISKENIENYILFERNHDSSIPKKNSNKIVDFTKFKRGYNYLIKIKKANINLEKYEEFLFRLTEIEITRDYAAQFNKKKVEKLAFEIQRNINFYKKILIKLKPKEVQVLCYYNNEFMSLIEAANQLKIKTIEYQHGPQSDIHMSYANWTKTPIEGYFMLPKYFYCWDYSSKNNIDNWALKSNFHLAETVGNYWVDFWKNRSNNYEDKSFVLYTLQPEPLSLEQNFPPELINVILNSSLKWYIRLHPRQIIDKEKIIIFLHKKGIVDKINIEEATYQPLPMLLKNAIVHVTNFSGSAIEANLLNVFTIFLNENALNTFPNIINSNMGILLDSNHSDFKLKFDLYINKFL